MVKCNTPPWALVVGQIFMFQMFTTSLEKNQSSYMEGNLTLLPFGKNIFFKWHQKQRCQLQAYDLQNKRKTRCMNTLMYKDTKTILNAMCLQALHCGRTLKLFKVKHAWKPNIRWKEQKKNNIAKLLKENNTTQKCCVENIAQSKHEWMNVKP